MRHLLWLLVFAAVLPAQEEGLDSKPAVIPAPEKAKLAALLPDAAAFSGKPSEDATFYSTDLYRLIDGGAEVYHQYGVVAMTHREYQAKDAELTADIYDMGDPLRAFGIYSAERSPDYHFIQMGAEGYAEEGTLNFFQGAYYVKLQGFGGQAGPALQAAAKSISGKIGAGREMPQAIAWLPAAALAPRSQKYVVMAPMGHDYLSPAITASYRFGGAETSVLATLAADAADAAKRLASLKAYYEKNGQVAAFPGLPGEAWRTNNKYEGDVIFFARGRNLVVVQHPPAQPETFLKSLFSSIKD